MECRAGERPGIAWRNFRTSISFGCSPHVWGSSESWQNSSGSWWNGPWAVVGLTVMSKQAPVVVAVLFVLFTWYSTHYLPYICGIVHLQNVNEFFLWRYTPRLCATFVRLKVYIQFSFKTCCISLRHITTCYCSTDVSALSAVDPFLFKVLRHETNLSSPRGEICCIFSGSVSFCRPVRFLTERLTRGFDHWQ